MVQADDRAIAFKNQVAVVGIGTGHQPHEFRSLGVGMDERMGRLFEGWDIMRAAWRDGYSVATKQTTTAPRTTAIRSPVWTLNGR